MVPRYCLFVLGFLSAAPCPAQVEDTAELFKPATVKQASARIDKIREQLGKQVVVFTVKEVPQERQKGYNLEDAGHRREIFKKWAAYRLKEKGLEGVHILICQNPEHIEITVSDDTQKQFEGWYQDHLKGRLIGKIQPHNPDASFTRRVVSLIPRGDRVDQGLLEAVEYVGIKLDHNRPIDQTNWYVGMSIIGGLIVVWVVLGLLRARLRKRTPLEAGVYGADESGRSIGVLGGGIGAVSGQWFYDRLFGPRQPEVRVRADVPPSIQADSRGPLPPAVPGEDLHGAI